MGIYVRALLVQSGEVGCQSSRSNGVRASREKEASKPTHLESREAVNGANLQAQVDGAAVDVSHHASEVLTFRTCLVDDCKEDPRRHPSPHFQLGQKSRKRCWSVKGHVTVVLQAFWGFEDLPGRLSV